MHNRCLWRFSIRTWKRLLFRRLLHHLPEAQHLLFEGVPAILELVVGRCGIVVIVVASIVVASIVVAGLVCVLIASIAEASVIFVLTASLVVACVFFLFLFWFSYHWMHRATLLSSYY